MNWRCLLIGHSWSCGCICDRPGCENIAPLIFYWRQLHEWDGSVCRNCGTRAYEKDEVYEDSEILCAQNACECSYNADERGGDKKHNFVLVRGPYHIAETYSVGEFKCIRCGHRHIC